MFDSSKARKLSHSKKGLRRSDYKELREAGYVIISNQVSTIGKIQTVYKIASIRWLMKHGRKHRYSVMRIKPSFIEIFYDMDRGIYRANDKRFGM